jgi:hypothetical protein
MKNILYVTGVLFLCAFFSSCQKEFLPDDGIDNPFTYDVNAKRFIDSSGITDSIQRIAINNFVIQLKDSSLWTKFIAVYPMLGGTATTTKWNLMDPRNMDAAYRLTFKGTPSYAGTGVLFPTPTDYANTHLNDSILTYNDNSISYYSGTQNTVNGYDMGCYDSGFPANEMAIYHTGDASNWFGYYDFGPKPANTTGLFMFSATASDVTSYQNGIVKNSSNAAPVPGFTGYSILIGIVKGASSGGMRECELATIGNGLTDAQALTFYNIAQKFETALSR